MIDWRTAFRPGGIISYVIRKNNAPHHSTLTGQLIRYNQSFRPSLNPNITHVGVINYMGTETPEEGKTQLHAIEILKGGKAGDRIVERNYGIEGDMLKKNLVLNAHPRITSENFMKKALEVAKGFSGVSYDLSTLIEVAFSPKNVRVDANYTKEVCKKYNIDSVKGTFTVDTAKHTFICPELVVTSYQIAWLILAGPEAANKPFPDFINIHARCSADGLVSFMRTNDHYEHVRLEDAHALMYSGTPHPNDPPDPDKHYGQEKIECAENIAKFVGSFKQRAKM